MIAENQGCSSSTQLAIESGPYPYLESCPGPRHWVMLYPKTQNKSVKHSSLVSEAVHSGWKTYGEKCGQSFSIPLPFSDLQIPPNRKNNSPNHPCSRNTHLLPR